MENNQHILEQMVAEVYGARQWLGNARTYRTSIRDQLRRGLLSARDVGEEVEVCELLSGEGQIPFESLEKLLSAALNLPDLEAARAKPTILRAGKLLGDIQDAGLALDTLLAAMVAYKDNLEREQSRIEISRGNESSPQDARRASNKNLSDFAQ